MSTDKTAGVLDGLRKFVGNQRNLVSAELRRTRPHHILAGNDSGYSIHRMLLDSLAKSDAFGAKATVKGLKKFQYGMNQVDTALGALARGNAKRGSFRYSMFTNIKDSQIPVRIGKNGQQIPVFKRKVKDGQQLYRQLDRASISAPVKAISGPLVTGLAFTKANELLQGNSTMSNGEVLRQNEQY